jgi:O-antigen/teichoic acid export membrane protein
VIDFIVKIFKNKNFLSLAGNMSVAVFGFLSFILLTRTLPVDVMGEWVLFVTASGFIEMLRFGITRTAIVRFLSGAKEEERQNLIGANWTIGIVATLILVVLLWSTKLIAPEQIKSSGFDLFFVWYPILAILNLPFNNAIALLEAEQRFDRILLIRLVNTASFIIFLFINWLWLGYSIEFIVLVYLGVNAITSLVSSLLGWDKLSWIMKGTKEARKTLLNFGKYTTGTLIGSNLLKSSDAVLIGLSPILGTTGVAMYSVPLKLTEIIEIPLRSFLATAFPGMSKASMKGNEDEVRKIYYTYAGAITYLLIPILAFTFIFAEEFVVILGGRQYESTANILRIFAIYGLFLPIDRFTGVALDSINKPKKNFFKVIWMTSANIIGDIIAIFVAGKILLPISIIAILSYTGFSFDNAVLAGQQFSIIRTLELVSVVTIIMTFVGMVAGYLYLNKELPIHYREIFRNGLNFYKSYIFKYLSRN